jgi:hypothetical protein
LAKLFFSNPFFNPKSDCDCKTTSTSTATAIIDTNSDNGENNNYLQPSYQSRSLKNAQRRWPQSPSSLQFYKYDYEIDSAEDASKRHRFKSNYMMPSNTASLATSTLNPLINMYTFIL